jgi:hypothetical protein
MGEIVHDLEQQAARARKAEQDRWQRRAPSDKFFQLAQERFKAAKLYGIAPVQGYWQIGDWTLAEINRMYLDDAADSSKFLCICRACMWLTLPEARVRGSVHWSRSSSWPRSAAVV